MNQQHDNHPQVARAEQRIEQWVTRLEGQVQHLLEELDIEELSQKERLGFALKMLSQIQHFLSIKQKLDAPPAASSNVQIWLQNLMQQMRGEGPDGSNSVDDDELETERRLL
ncbi:hypothetical protein [Dictyobacter formicarum]|uniref:PH domain-containing protein n=1 Tax=Dictyobacter formicarum TaxID=2778368 RepID=A0ABQ3VJF1_9CHLR|nr:hypothetical protein [Dictyobacter formicarum]GHO85791.1 hypothetical protein KSZ_37970 [Dictyobacter formicarum]